MESVAVTGSHAKLKPKLRGAFHFVAFGLTWLGLVALWLGSPPGPFRTAAMVYGGSMFLMFGTSALYHRPMWGLRARRVLRRMDHSNIFVMIAGTFTPLAVYYARGGPTPWIWVMWLTAAAGIFFAVFWTDAPRFLRTATYLVVSAVSAPVVFALPGILGWPRVLTLLSGSVLYLVGAVVYATRWPNPNPRVFGYHEVFHAFVVAAAAVQFGVILHTQTALL